MTARWGYRIAEIAERTNLPRSTIDREARAQGIPRKKFGAQVLLEPEACERVFGFPNESAPLPSPTAEDLALARNLLK